MQTENFQVPVDGKLSGSKMLVQQVIYICSFNNIDAVQNASATGHIYMQFQ